MSELIFDGMVEMEKFPGKGGWTFARIDIAMASNKPFGWYEVKGSIDDVRFLHKKLMPMKGGCLFLPINKQLRKRLKKDVQESVHIVLFKDDISLEIPNEILECFDNEDDRTKQFFNGLTKSEKLAYLQWTYAAKYIETKILRITQMMEKLSRKEKFHN